MGTNIFFFISSRTRNRICITDFCTISTDNGHGFVNKVFFLIFTRKNIETVKARLMSRRERQFKKKMKLKSKPSVHTTRVKLTDSKIGPTPRYAHSSAMLNGILYIFGGFSDKGKIYFNSKSHRFQRYCIQ